MNIDIANMALSIGNKTEGIDWGAAIVTFGSVFFGALLSYYCSKLLERHQNKKKEIRDYEILSTQIALSFDNFLTYKKVYLDKVKGILSEGDYAELSKDLSAECDRLERSAAEGRKKVEELEAQAETDGGCRERAGRYMKSGRLSREIVEAMIDHIYVGKRIPGTKNVPVEIHWDF